MKRILFIVIMILTFPATGFCWPFVSTPAIEGRVIETTTNEPIENVIVEVIWHGMQVAPADRTGVEVAKLFVVTGKDGKFSVPKKSFFQPTGLLSNVDQLRLVVRHPLYETKEVYANYDDKTKTWVNFGELKEGKFELKFLLKRLELGGIMDSGFWRYFEWANYKKVDYNLNTIFKKWEEIYSDKDLSWIKEQTIRASKSKKISD